MVEGIVPPKNFFDISLVVNSAFTNPRVKAMIGTSGIRTMRGTDVLVTIAQETSYNSPEKLVEYLRTTDRKATFELDLKTEKPVIAYKAPSGLEGCIMINYGQRASEGLDFS